MTVSRNSFIILKSFKQIIEINESLSLPSYGNIYIFLKPP